MLLSQVVFLADIPLEGGEDAPLFQQLMTAIFFQLNERFIGKSTRVG